MSGLTGTGALLRLAWRRDRVLVPVSVLALAGVAASSAQATNALYSDPRQAVDAARAAAANPAVVAMYGPLTNPGNPASLTVFKTLLMGAVLTALLGYAIVRRHTRTEEEQGRLELLGAGIVGRRAPLSAAVLMASLAVLGAATLTALALVGVGLEPAGSLALGVAWAVAGLAFVAVTAVAAQLAETGRGCAGLALGTLAAAYLLRAVGDSSATLSGVVWLSPLGWAERVAPYGSNSVWIGAVGLAFGVAMLALAYLLLERRDLGAGLLPTRPGPARAGRRLGGPVGLAWRLQRGSLLGWTSGFALVGFVVGSLANSVGTVLEAPAAQDLLRSLGGGSGTLVDIFLAAELSVAALVAAAYGVGSALALRSEEQAVRAEPVLATPVSRRAWFASHLLVALAGSAGLMIALAVTVGLGMGAQSGDLPGALGTVVPAALARVPAIWVCVGIAALLFGIRSRAAALAWAALVLFLVVGELGALLRLPDGLIQVSPFTHVPALPGRPATATPLLVLLLVAGGLLGAGALAFRRRDVG